MEILNADRIRKKLTVVHECRVPDDGWSTALLKRKVEPPVLDNAFNPTDWKFTVHFSVGASITTKGYEPEHAFTQTAFYVHKELYGGLVERLIRLRHMTFGGALSRDQLVAELDAVLDELMGKPPYDTPPP
jgi:hypothetical protein